MNWKGWWALETERPSSGGASIRESSAILRRLYYRTQETYPKKKDSSGEFDALPPKRASDFEDVAAYDTGIAKAIL